MVGKRFHFIGIGGIGMSGLAQVLLHNQAVVSGSDQTDSGTVRMLRDKGAKVYVGHAIGNLDQKTDAVVISAAVKPTNPELAEAIRLGLKVYKYAEMLGLLMNRYDGVAVSGTHGKSTTSGWISFLLRQAGVDAGFIVGAVVSQLGSSSGEGDSRLFVAEACEYDRSFLNLRPKIACVLNIEADHLDYYKDEAEIVGAFEQFVAGIGHGGVLIANGQDPNVAQVLQAVRPDVEVVSFGFEERCRLQARALVLEEGCYRFEMVYDGRRLGQVRISLPGRHNVANALVVTAVAMRVGVPVSRIMELLPAFTGMDRRLMFQGQVRGITVIDDYGHHPTEIRATLAAVRERYAPRKLWCVFQPHQYSRTRFLLDDFAESFKLADVTIVPEIFFVRDSEESRRTVNSMIFVERVRAAGSQAEYVDGFDAIVDYLEAHVTAGDVVVTMGAGDVWKVAHGTLQRLGKDR